MTQTDTKPRTEERPTLSPRKMRIIRALAFAVLPAAFVAFLAYGVLISEGPRIKVGDEAPAFTLERLDGEGRFSSADLEGRPVVINFWASWCTPCLEEAPDLERTWRRYRDEGVVFVGINRQDLVEDAREFLDRYEITYVNLRDPEGEVARRFGVRGLPETFFLDHRYRFTGFGDTEEIGTRGSTVVLGAISPAVLSDKIQDLLEEYRQTE